MAATLISLEEYKEFTGIKNTDKDGKRFLLISLVSKLIKSYCGRTFIDSVSIPKTEYFDARSTEALLSEWPLISVSSVKTSIDGGVTQITLTENSTNKDGYFVDIEDSKVLTQIEDQKFLDFIDHPHKSLEITYKGGFTEDNDGITPSIPLDLKLAVFDLVTYYEKNEKTLNKTMASATIDNPVPRLTNDFPAHIKRILDLYRIISL